MMKKWEDRKDLVFLVYVWLDGWKNGRIENSFVRKVGEWKNVVYINWLLYPWYIICEE